MATAGDVIKSALKEIGVLAAGETPTADDSIDGLATLNRLVDKWAAERLAIHTITRTEWTITSGTGQYSVASGQVVNVARPVFIDHVNFQDTSLSTTTELPLNSLTDDAWAGIRLKTQEATYPSDWYYNPTYPYGTIDLWPVPTSATLEGVLYAPAAVSQFAALTTAVSLPPGYEEMLVTNLALRLAPTYGAQVHPELKDRARDSLATVKRSNTRLMDMSLDAAALIGCGPSGYDIRTG